MNPLLYPILLPVAAGVLTLLLPRLLREAIAFLASLATFLLTIIIFVKKPVVEAGSYLLLDNLSGLILASIGLFGFLITLYSLKFMAGKSRLREYYTYILWTIGAACGVVLTNDLILLLIFWGFLGLTLYLLIGIGGAEASSAAKKSFIIVGGTDALMLLGIIFILFLSRSLKLSQPPIPLAGALATIAFLCLLMAVLAKAGAMPFHTWIPDMAETAPASITAFLPASLDKLLGIYLLVRISYLFQLNEAMGLLLLIIGTVTIIASVMMALVQGEMKRLIAYLNISAAGYMIVALATRSEAGIAGGLFYLLSTSLWTTCLFLGCGAVENRLKITELGSLGGLARVMPITFISCLVAGLSISGVPPTNGFAAKWMIYQGLIELGNRGWGIGSRLWIIWLVAAMFGSALTLACLMKFIHATFLGQKSEVRSQKAEIREVSFSMWLPMTVLAGLCVIFGVFAFRLPLPYLIEPVVPGISFAGVWWAGRATILIVAGIVTGAIIYWLGNLKGLREDTSYIGGEVIPDEERVTGVDFYNTVKDFKPFGVTYQRAERKFFDIYHQGGRLTFFFTRRLQLLHDGILPTYLLWSIIGMLILFFILMR